MPHVYLLHFDKPLRQDENREAKHYCGWTPNGVEQRLKIHLSGNGAKLVKATVENGSQVEVVRVWEEKDWEAARARERRMKNTHHLPSYCPICCGRA